MKIYAKVIKAKSDEGLTQACWREINSSWGAQAQANSSFDQTVCIAKGGESIYNFATTMRDLLGDRNAEIYKVRSGPQRGYFALKQLDQANSKVSLAVFAIPEPISPQPKSA